MADPTPAPAATTETRKDDFVTQIVDRIVDTIAMIRENTVGRVETVARIVVYGLFLGIIGIFALITLTIVFVRLVVIATDLVLDIFDEGDNHQVWFAHLFVGIVFSIGGAVLWKKRPPIEV